MFGASDRAERTNELLVQKNLKDKLRLLNKEYRSSLKATAAKEKQVWPRMRTRKKDDVHEVERNISLREEELSRVSAAFAHKKIKNLLMTKEEIDIEKVLCLHLSTLSVPSICPTTWYNLEKHSTVLTRYSSYLPNYLVINSQSHKSCNCSSQYCNKRLSREGVVQVFAIVNTQIEMILDTVLGALKQVNEHKLKRLIKYARSVSSIKLLLSKQKSVNFISQIFESLTTLKSYVFRTEICTVIKGTTALVNQMDKRWKNPVFKIIVPTSFPTYDPLTSNMLNEPSESKVDNPYMRFVEMLRTGGKLANGGYLPTSPELSHSSSALTVHSTDGSDVTLLGNLGLAIKPSSHLFIKHLSALLQSEGAMALKSDDSKNVLEAILMEPLRFDRPPPQTRSTINVERELEAIVHRSLTDLPPAERRTGRQWRRVLDAVEERDRIKCSILDKLTNPERILIGQEVSRRKSRDINVDGNLDSRVSLGPVLGRILSRPSLVELARALPPSEREFFLKPAPKGGLGIASYIIGDDNMIKLEKAHETKQIETFSLEQNNLAKSETSFDLSVTGNLDLAQMKHAVMGAEIQKKVDRFLKVNKNLNQ